MVPQQVSGSYTLRPPVLAVIGSVNATANDIVAAAYQGEDLLSYAEVVQLMPVAHVGTS